MGLIQGQNHFFIVFQIAFDRRNKGGDSVASSHDPADGEEGVGRIGGVFQSVKDFSGIFQSLVKFHIFLKMRGNHPLELELRKISMSFIDQEVCRRYKTLFSSNENKLRIEVIDD